MSSFLRQSILFCLLLLLSGCQLLEIRKAAPAIPPDQNHIKAARLLEEKGRYGEAIEVLEEAITQGGKTQRYTQTLREIRLQQNTVKQELKDQLLISRTSGLKHQIPLLEQLLQSDPEQKNYVRELKKKRQELQQLHHSLSECGWRHFKKNNALAKACLTLSLSLKKTEQDERLMAFLLAEQKQNREKTQTVELAKRKMAWKHRNKKRLDNAQRFHETGQLTESRRILKVILKEDPQNDQAKKLLHNVETRLKSYIENLLTAGDRLYREGDIEGAKATWRAALQIDPQDQSAKEKISRAQRVLDNLENLRKSDLKRP
jgi:tetratricopeptide (TPR) repeat protein